MASRAGLVQVVDTLSAVEIIELVVESLQKENPQHMFFVSEIARKVQEVLEDPKYCIRSKSGYIATISRQTCSNLLRRLNTDAESRITAQLVKEANRVRNMYFDNTHYRGPARG